MNLKGHKVNMRLYMASWILRNSKVPNLPHNYSPNLKNPVLLLSPFISYGL